MTQEQPEALEIADDLSAMGMPSDIAGRGADTIRRLHAENEALRKDAARYHWLKVECNNVDVQEGLGWIAQNHESLDDAIDAAMKGQS